MQNHPTLPNLPKVPTASFDQQKARCFSDCVAYLMMEATALRSERRHVDALKQVEVALTLETLLNSGCSDM